MERTLVSDPGAAGSGAQACAADPGAATVVEPFGPYDPTLQWRALQEPTTAWALREPRPAPNPWIVGLGSAGLALAIVTGFCLGRSVPVSAAGAGTGARTSTAAVGPAPSVPVVLPEAPDLSRTYPVAPAAPARAAVWTAPNWATPPPPAPPVSIRPVVRKAPASTARGMVRMSVAPVPMPPPIRLYGSTRTQRDPEVTTWALPRGG